VNAWKASSKYGVRIQCGAEIYSLPEGSRFRKVRSKTDSRSGLQANRILNQCPVLDGQHLRINCVRNNTRTGHVDSTPHHLHSCPRLFVASVLISGQLLAPAPPLPSPSSNTMREPNLEARSSAEETRRTGTYSR
jgi:hypothetical protein